MTKERHELTWHGIQIEITYTPDTSPAFRKSYGRALDHLEIRSLVPAREPLPITETGYLSQFYARNVIEEGGGPAALVLAWLDHYAQSPVWQAKQISRQQLDLFSENF
ncbi:MAG TPA: hypothetical protein PLR37_15575 [Candidatus Accumulibacter phosphatis]|nr:hypothetical protein [Candidatus Accumulibacter phosphatis]